MNFDLSSSTPSYEANLIDDESGKSHQINHKMDLLESQFNVVYIPVAIQYACFRAFDRFHFKAL